MERPTTYHRPSYGERLRDHGACPFCHRQGYRAPGPCRHCGVHGYHDETPPGISGRDTRRRKRSYATAADATADPGLADLVDDLELSFSE